MATAFGHGSDRLLFESCPGHVPGKRKGKGFSQKKRIGAAFSGTFDVPNKIQRSDIRLLAVVTDGRRCRIWAVNCNWNAGNGWNVEANPITNPNDWNAGNQVFSRDSLLFFRTCCGSFYKQASTPTADHLADFFDFLAEYGKLFSRQEFELPTELDKEAEGIDFDQHFSQQSDFSLDFGERGMMKRLQYFN